MLLRAVASESPAGSAQRWVATVLAGQAALLADREEDTQQAIAELTQAFAVDDGLEHPGLPEPPFFEALWDRLVFAIKSLRIYVILNELIKELS
mgnify:CR=1 FL=1